MLKMEYQKILEKYEKILEDRNNSGVKERISAEVELYKSQVNNMKSL